MAFGAGHAANHFVFRFSDFNIALSSGRRSHKSDEA